MLKIVVNDVLEQQYGDDHDNLQIILVGLVLFSLRSWCIDYRMHLPTCAAALGLG